MFFFIKTLMNVDQIYSYFLKLKLNLRIGPNSNYKNTFCGYIMSKESSFIYWKKQPLPHQKTKWSGWQKLPLIKNKSREHSSTTTLPGTATKF